MTINLSVDVKRIEKEEDLINGEEYIIILQYLYGDEIELSHHFVEYDKQYGDFSNLTGFYRKRSNNPAISKWGEPELVAVFSYEVKINE